MVASDVEINNDKIYNLYGRLDGSLPVSLSIIQKSDSWTGTVNYGNGAFIRELEGESAVDGSMIFYEFDEYSRVAGIFSGHLDQLNNKWTWSSSDHSIILPIRFYKDQEPKSVVGLYVNKKTQHEIEYVLLRKDVMKVFMKQPDDRELRWIRYDCEGQNCYELRPNMDLSNPFEFRIENESKDLVKIYPDIEYLKEDELASINISGAAFDYYFSVDIPHIGSAAFDDWIYNEGQRRVTAWQRSIQKDKTDFNPTDRFEHRFTGDYFITLMDKSIISGFLYFQGASFTGNQTIPFIYDRQKEKLFSLRDIFKKEFDYPFFLRTFLKNEKRRMFFMEDPVVKAALNQDPFTHMVLGSGGLLFFTDFNVLYGRKYLTVPYSEIKGFLSHKILEGFIRRNID